MRLSELQQSRLPQSSLPERCQPSSKQHAKGLSLRSPGRMPRLRAASLGPTHGNGFDARCHVGVPVLDDRFHGPRPLGNGVLARDPVHALLARPLATTADLGVPAIRLQPAAADRSARWRTSGPSRHAGWLQPVPCKLCKLCLTCACSEAWGHLEWLLDADLLLDDVLGLP